jgi:CO/xanthine dehydrogenase FAD-binding subunit
VSVTGIEAYHRPAALEEAWQLLREGGPAVRLVGGGTDLTIHCPPEVTRLVDLGGLGLDGIRAASDGSVSMGATATLTDLLESPALSGYLGGVIAEMLVEVGSPLLRNAATIGGHLARGRLSDVVPVLLAVDASVEVFDGGTHTLSLLDYYADGRHHRPHLLTRVFLPAPPAGAAAAFVRFAKSGFDHAIVNCACRVDLDGERITHSRVVVGQAPGLAHRVPAAEEELSGEELVRGAVARAARAARRTVPATGDWAASSDYRSQLIEVMVSRCLEVAAERAGRPLPPIPDHHPRGGA